MILSKKLCTKAALCLLLLATDTVGALAQTTNAPTSAKPDTVAINAAMQPLSIAVFSYDKAFESMAELADVREKVANLKQQYNDELKRAEDEFNKKYEEFLNQQAKLATPIRNKRQAEIQQLLETNTAFKNEAQKNISATEAELLTPLKENLQQAINAVAKEQGYNMVLNTDNNTIPFIDGIRITDITETIIKRLKK